MSSFFKYMTINKFFGTCLPANKCFMLRFQIYLIVYQIEINFSSKKYIILYILIKIYKNKCFNIKNKNNSQII